MKKKPKKSRKETYRAPKLTQYGDLKKITRGSGASNRDDGGAAKTWNTQMP